MMRDENDNLKGGNSAFVPIDEIDETKNADAAKRENRGLRSSSKSPFSKISENQKDLAAFDEVGFDKTDLDKAEKGDFSFVPNEKAPSEVPFGEALETPAQPSKLAAVSAAPVFRAPQVQPAKIDREKVYPPTPPTQASSLHSSAAEAKNDAEEMEVLPTKNQSSSTLAQAPEATKAVSKWAFWKRPSRRDEQLARISDGYLEMVDLVRAIRGQLESQNENNLILRDSLAHLPKAMEGLDKFSQSQETVGKALQEIHGQLERTSVKDDKLVDSMDGFNATLQGMDVTNRATMKTFDRVHERMGDSDRRMENLFENVQETEEKVSDAMVRLQRNMAIMQGIFLFCLLVVIAVLIFFVMKNLEKPAALAPNPQASPAHSQSVLKEGKEPPSGVAPVIREPREPRQLGIPLGND